MDYRKNDIIDGLYERYIKSFDQTLESIKKTGTNTYDFYLSYLHKSFRRDLEEIDSSLIKYKKFITKKRKFDLKFEKLEFCNLEIDEYKALFLIERWHFRRSFKKYNKYIRKYINLLHRFYTFIPDEIYAEELSSSCYAEKLYKLNRRQLKEIKFNKKKAKFHARLTKLNFVNLSQSEYLALKKLKRWKFRRKFKKYNKILHGYFLLLEKYKPFISIDVFNAELQHTVPAKDLYKLSRCQRKQIKFKKKRSKYHNKLKKVNINNLYRENYLKLSKRKRIVFKIKFWKYNRAVKKYRLLLKKYKRYLPEDIYENEKLNCVKLPKLYKGIIK